MNPFIFSVSSTPLSKILAAFKGNPIPQSSPPAQAGAAPAPHPRLCLEGDFQKILVKGWCALCYYTLCPACSSSQHPFPTGRAGLGGVSPCSCNADLHHHHLCICTKLNKQLTFWEQILLERTKTNSSEVWDPPLGSGEQIQNKVQVCRLPMLIILSNGKQFQRVSQQH